MPTKVKEVPENHERKGFPVIQRGEELKQLLETIDAATNMLEAGYFNFNDDDDVPEEARDIMMGAAALLRHGKQIFEKYIVPQQMYQFYEEDKPNGGGLPRNTGLPFVDWVPRPSLSKLLAARTGPA